MCGLGSEGAAGAAGAAGAESFEVLELERGGGGGGGGTEESGGGGGGTPYLEAASCFSCSSICLWFSITFSLSIGDKRGLFILLIT